VCVLQNKIFHPQPLSQFLGTKCMVSNALLCFEVYVLLIAWQHIFMMISHNKVVCVIFSQGSFFY
jgi:hypothetical protein